MKIIKQKTSGRRKKLIASVTILVLLGGVIAFAVWQDRNGHSNKELTELTDQTSTVQQDQAKEDPENNGAPKLPQKSGQKDEVRTDGTNTSGTPPEKPRVTRAEDKGDAIKVAALFQKSSPGYCELRLNKPGQQAISKTANIIVGPSYFACGFTVPDSNLPAKGQWQAVVIHHIGSTSTSSDVKTIDVK